MENDNPNVIEASDKEKPNSGLNKLEKELRNRNPEIFKGISEGKKREILDGLVSITMIRQEHSHSGPLPSPKDIAGYNKLIPNGADRIMKMAEKQQEHRMGIEKDVIESNSKQSRMGQWFGLLIGLFGIACGTFLAYNGATTVGGVIAGGTVVSLVSVFVIGRKRQDG